MFICFTRAGDLVLVQYLGFPADSFENESSLFVKLGLCCLRSRVSMACLLHLWVSLHPFSHLWSPSPIPGRTVRFSSVSPPIWLGCIISVFHCKNTDSNTHCRGPSENDKKPTRERQPTAQTQSRCSPSISFHPLPQRKILHFGNYLEGLHLSGKLSITAYSPG